MYSTTLAQDVFFSQFYANPVYLNSALAGSEGNPRMTLVHRQQWNAINAYDASFFSFDSPLGKQSGLAVHAMSDRQLEGVINNMSVGTTFSHRIQLNNQALIGAGISMAYHQKSFNWGALTFEDQLRAGSGNIYPTAERFGQSQTNLLDVGVGLVYAADKLLVGLNVAHINTPKERFNPESDAVLPRRYTAHMAYRIEKFTYSKQAYSITPSVVFEKQAGLSYLSVGGFWNNQFLTLGSYYRVNQAMVFTAGFTFDQFNIGYSYDYYLSNARHNFGATNEFTLSYRFQWKQKNKNYKYAGKCPDVYRYLR